MRRILLIAVLPAALAACGSGGNVKSAASFHALPPPTVRNPLYNPNAPYGEANAIWTPPVFNRDGTIVRPEETTTQSTRPDYEGSEWATGAAGGSRTAPPGTF